MERLEQQRQELEQKKAEHEFMMQSFEEYKRDIVQGKLDKSALQNHLHQDYDTMREAARQTRDNWVPLILIPEISRT